MKTTLGIVLLCAIVFLMGCVTTSTLSSDGSIPMVHVPGGTFSMGATSGPYLNGDENPVRMVTVDSFYMGQTEITQAQWKAVMGETLPAAMQSYDLGEGSNYPMYYISWYDAIRFCNQLSIQEGLEPVYFSGFHYPDVPNIDATSNNTAIMDVSFDNSKNGYRLPTEAEWEYAAGWDSEERNIISGTNQTNSAERFTVSTTRSNPITQFSKVKSRMPNELGLYDMSGNAFEWVWDWYAPYDENEVDNPTGPVYGSTRVVRGGHFKISWARALTYQRYKYGLNASVSTIPLMSFRVVKKADNEI